MSTGASVASSECSDETFNDNDSRFTMLEDIEHLNPSLYNLLDVDNIPGENLVAKVMQRLQKMDWNNVWLQN